MKSNHFSVSSKLILIACLIFDIAMIASFFALFGWFTLLIPLKSVLMLLVLVVGLVISNAAIAFPGLLLKVFGTAHSAFIIFICLLYAVLSNVLSVFLIAGSSLWYIIFEFIVFALFLGVLAVISFFSKDISDNKRQAEVEKTTSAMLHIQLMEIEEKLLARQHDDGMRLIMKQFISLKERIHASTPFARVTGNNFVFELENRVKVKLEMLSVVVDSNQSEYQLANTQSLIEETHRLMRQREQLIII